MSLTANAPVHFTRFGRRGSPACGKRGKNVMQAMEYVTCVECRAIEGAPPLAEDPSESKLSWGRWVEGRYETVQVLATAYKNQDFSITLLHTYDEETDRTLCKKVKTESLVTTSEHEGSQPPTCEICLSRDPRFNGTGYKPNAEASALDVASEVVSKFAAGYQIGRSDLEMASVALQADSGRISPSSAEATASVLKLISKAQRGVWPSNSEIRRSRALVQAAMSEDDSDMKPNRRSGVVLDLENPDVAAAAKIREAFYDKPVEKSFDFEWKWPRTMLEVGQSEAVQYTSDKWKKRGDYEDYKHVAEGKQRLYVKPGFLRDNDNIKKELDLDCEEVTLPARMPSAVAELAPILGIQFTPYEWRGKKLVLSQEDPFHVMIPRAYIGAARLPKTNETFLVIYTRTELCAIITGDILGVEKDGIVG